MIAAHAHTQSLGWLGWLTTGLFLAAISLAVLGVVRVTQRLLGRWDRRRGR